MDVKDPVIIIKLHDELIKEFGGERGIISKNLLFSSLSRPFFGLSNGTELYKTIEEKAAALIHSLIKNHPFVDGNKRTAAHVTKIFLRENNYDWTFSNEEIIEFVLDIANSKVDLDYIKKWIAERIRIMT